MAKATKKRAASPAAPNAGAKQPKKAKSAAKADPEPISDSGEVAADAQIATSSTLQIPVDEGCPLASYRVFVDPVDRVIYDAALNQTNASNNNNKFYRIQVRPCFFELDVHER